MGFDEEDTRWTEKIELVKSIANGCAGRDANGPEKMRTIFSEGNWKGRRGYVYVGIVLG